MPTEEEASTIFLHPRRSSCSNNRAETTTMISINNTLNGLMSPKMTILPSEVCLSSTNKNLSISMRLNLSRALSPVLQQAL